MGQTKSKTRDQKKGSKLPVIPPESPLGITIRNWNDRDPRKGKSRLKMVQYCVTEWPKEPLRLHVFRPVFGSFEDWIRQALNIHVNSKEPFSQEESDYAGLLLRRTSRPFPASIFTLKADKKFEEQEEHEKEKEDKREPLDKLPPPYPNNPPPAAPPPVAVVSPPVPPLPQLPPPTAPELD